RPLDRLDRVPDRDLPAADHVGAQAAAADQPPEHAGLREPLEVAARVARLDSDAAQLAHPERLSDEPVQVHAAGNDVSARLAVSQLDPRVPGQRLDRLGLDQREVAAGAGLGGRLALGAELAVALRPAPGHDAHPLDRRGRRLRLRRDVDALDVAHHKTVTGTPFRLGWVHVASHGTVLLCGPLSTLG